MMVSKVLGASLALLASASLVAAWDCTGHMLVASIARQTMQNSTYAKVNKLIGLIAEYYPYTPEYITAACWADDLRGEGVETFNSWHFINLPFLTGPVQFQLDSVPWEDNVVWGVEQSRDILNSTDATLLDKARFLRFLIHFVGDMHQPLHILTMYSELFPPPGGDNGGNSFPIQGVNQSNLHSFFDGGGGLWAQSIYRPLNSTGVAWVSGWTADIMEEFPIGNFAANLSDTLFDDWLLGVFKFSVNLIYTIEPNATVPQSYITAVQQLCKSEVALAGYRLAATLDYVFQFMDVDALAPAKRLRGGAAPAEFEHTHTHPRTHGHTLG